VRRAFIYFSIALLAIIVVSCALRLRRADSQPHEKSAQPSQSSEQIKEAAPLFIPVSDGFDYPVGEARHAKRLTQANDGDGWYNAQDFGTNNHLGEDWNAEAGGGADCGLPVYAASAGAIVFAADAGIGWGKVLIVRHRLPDGSLVETLYAHLQSFTKTAGTVARRERIASIGDADGAYPCHLHFELRLDTCLAWGKVGPGYSLDRAGWTDPSDFIEAHRHS
jgi:murein DD-endopeptidase MepM/ murein hydrolase activator NlpD